MDDQARKEREDFRQRDPWGFLEEVAREDLQLFWQDPYWEEGGEA